MLLILFIIIAISLAVIIFIMPVKVVVFFHRKQDDDHFVVKIVSAWGLFHLKFELPYLHVALKKIFPQLGIKMEIETGKSQIKKVKAKIGIPKLAKIYKKYEALIIASFNAVKANPNIIFRFLKTVKVTEFNWSTCLNAFNAYTTGIISGGLWAFKGSAGGLLTHLLTFTTLPKIQVIPIFRGELVFETEFNCIFEFKIGHIMGMMVPLLFSTLKGVRDFERTSYSRADENRYGEH